MRRLVPPDKRALGLYARLLVRCLACRMLGAANEALSVQEGVHGKPYLAGHEDFCYNYAHSGAVLLLGVARKSIGVDVEQIAAVRAGVARRFFAPNEQEYVFADEESQARRFYEIWTKKEAYAKELGLGFSLPPRNFNTLDELISRRIWTRAAGGIAFSVSCEPPFAVEGPAHLRRDELIAACMMLDSLA